MDVVLEVQEQLVSRIALALNDSNTLSFLHGKTGVGKSHIASMLTNKLVSTLVVNLSPKNALDPEQLKQQIICELATDELSDLNQPISQAVNHAANYHQQSVLLIIDNAHLLPNQGLNAIWQAIHEFSRLNHSKLTFNVLLLGESKWALPLHHGLKNKTDSLVTHYPVESLTKQQAIDFMTSVHADWSDQRIEQFVNKVPKEYLIPKQLIYAQLPSANKGQVTALVWLSVLLAVLLGTSVAIAYYLQQGSETQDSIITVEPKGLVVQKNTQSSDVDAPSLIAQQSAVDTSIEENVAQVRMNDSTVHEVIQQTASKQEAAQEQNISSEITVIDTENTAEVTEESDINVVDINQPIVGEVTEKLVDKNYPFNEQYLLSVSAKRYALMLGGFGQRQSLDRVLLYFSDDDNIKIYQTVRQEKTWFVLLYGDFESITAANNFLVNNQPLFNNLSPWAKPMRLVHQEINLAPQSNNKNDND